MKKELVTPAGEASMFMSLKEAAQLLGVSVSLLRRACYTGVLPCYRVSERVIRVRRTDVLGMAREVTQWGIPTSFKTGEDHKGPHHNQGGHHA